jgi:glycosyltransferase involved in cell wall biosynthesis
LGPYPRVLIVGPTFDTVTGGGITLTNLFKGWPADGLALVSSDPCLVEPAPARSQFRLGSEERPYIPLLRLVALMDRDGGGPVDEPGILAAAAAGSGPAAAQQGGAAAGARAGTGAPRRTRAGSSLRSIPKNAFNGLARVLGSDEYLRRMKASDRLVSWARAFAPDLLYTQLGDLNMCRLVLGLGEALDVPIVLHMMDDWPAAIYRRGLLRNKLSRDTDRAVRRLVRGAAACIAISDAMAREYAARYGREWTYFHNPVEPERWRVAGADADSAGGEASPSGDPSPSGAALASGAGTTAGTTAGRDFTLVYSGRIGPGIESSVLDICGVVAGLRGQGRNVQLAIHSIHFDRGADPRFAGFDGVELHGAIPDADMAATLCAADALVLPFDFHGDAADFARLSFPTKAPAYEATGVPILVYAPAAHAVAADAAARGWGCVVGESDLGALAEAISRLMDDESLRSELSRKALADVAERHEAGAVRARFAATLAAAARGSAAT